MSSKARARDPKAPKRNQSAYLLYQNAMRTTFRTQNPGMTFGQLAKYTSAMYAEAPPEEKAAWAARAEADRERYLRELEGYVPAPGFDIKGDLIAGVEYHLKARKGKRDPQAPKRNMSAYLMYQNTMRESFRTENPGMTFGQLSKFTSSMYKSLTPEEKARWEEAAKKDKDRYESEMASYVPPAGFDQTGAVIDTAAGAAARRRGKKGKDPAAPKRARGSYVFFTLEARPKLIKEQPELKFIDVGHALGEKWRALPAAERRRYEDMATADKKRYQDEAAAYEARAAEARAEKAKAPAPADAAAPYVHPQCKDAQRYAEQYYAQQAAAAAYDPVAMAAAAGYYAPPGYPVPPPPAGGKDPAKQYHVV